MAPPKAAKIALNPAQRKAAQRKRHRDNDLVSREVWIHPSQMDRLIEEERKMRKPSRAKPDARKLRLERILAKS